MFGEIMKIKSVIIENVRSFDEDTEFAFDQGFNILTGPNGGGKSNLLDVLCVCIRLFLHATRIDVQPASHAMNFTLPERLSKPERILERHYSRTDGQHVLMNLLVTKSDLDTIEAIRTHAHDLERILREQFGQNVAISSSISEWEPSLLKENDVVPIHIDDWSFRGAAEGAVRTYLGFLQFVEMCAVLSQSVDRCDLPSLFQNFSPYRVAQVRNDFQAVLSTNRFAELQKSIFESSSRQPATSHLEFGSHYFARKLRKYEHQAKAQGYNEMFRQDPEVVLLTKYIGQLGYEWSIDLTNELTNTYEMKLHRNGRRFALPQASSGEREILNFLFGIFANQVRGGVVLIDEPELHLHPRWQNLLLNMLRDIGEETDNQIILSTHSPAFITSQTIGSVMRILKQKHTTLGIRADHATLPQVKDLVHIVNSENNGRIFFADAVVLVEGIADRLIVSKIISERIGCQWRNIVIEVVSVQGKLQLEKYRQFLDQFQVPNFIIADFDYINQCADQGLRQILAANISRIGTKVLGDKKSKDRAALCAALDHAISTGDTENLRELWTYICERHSVLPADLPDDDKERVTLFLKELKSKRVFLLSAGEIEVYLPDGWKTVDRIIDLVNDAEFATTVKSNPNWAELEGIVEEILGTIERDLSRLPVASAGESCG